MSVYHFLYKIFFYILILFFLNTIKIRIDDKKRMSEASILKMSEKH